MPVLAVGDRKSPSCSWPAGSEFFALEQQQRLKFRLARLLPQDHYSRKNLGYLEAMSRGAGLLFDTDDDNAPLAHWTPRNLLIEAQQVQSTGWVNVYRLFSSELIWPRGIPIERVQECQTATLDAVGLTIVECPIQQGLVNESPDVDAVWRMIFGREFSFDKTASVWLRPGGWCPFNSQSTWWFEPAFPFMYLPSFVSFRVTDIWRSFIAQRCLWEQGLGIAFHGPESLQRRNVHNLLKDFEDEISAYIGNDKIVSVLERTQLSGRAEHVLRDLHNCYEALVVSGFIPKREMPLLEAWIEDVEDTRKDRPTKSSLRDV
jgi:hypothetical protein